MNSITKKCNKCGTVKPIGQFYKASENKDGRRNNCNKCSMKSYYKWKSENLEYVLEKQRGYYKKRYENNREKELRREKERKQ